MTHVDDWLDDPKNAGHLAREFLEHARRPAVDKDHTWLANNRPWCTWENTRWQCVGASRMGDIWLKDPNTDPRAFYDRRVAIDDCTDWHSAPTKTER